jgi:hypothetical protein
VGGVIFFPRGNIRLSFSWSLGHATNNQAEAYALLQGLLLARQQGLDSIIILGDLKVVINHVRMKTLSTYMKLRAIFLRIQYELEAFHSLAPFHILHHNNVIVDGQANLAIRDTIETLFINRQASLHHIP